MFLVSQAEYVVQVVRLARECFGLDEKCTNELTGNAIHYNRFVTIHISEMNDTKWLLVWQEELACFV